MNKTFTKSSGTASGIGSDAGVVSLSEFWTTPSSSSSSSSLSLPCLGSSFKIGGKSIKNNDKNDNFYCAKITSKNE